MSSIENFKTNLELFKVINYSRSEFLDTFFSFFYLLGKGQVVIPLILVILILTKRRNSIHLFAIEMIVLGMIVLTIKKVYPVPRPAKTLATAYQIIEYYKIGSFPSGDCALSMASSLFLINEFRSKFLLVILTIYTLLIGYERIYTGNHFPLDVIAGYIVGTISFLIARKILVLWKKKRKC
ncbi:MAG: phosphatase PAP2 family protein [Thermosulfidibacteraceae bacterium]|jgi:membrane-associated phospholipid phosphatase